MTRLAEARAQARDAADTLNDHKKSCVTCTGQRGGHRRPCQQADDMAADLRILRHRVAHWFDPGPGQESLL